MKEVIAIAQLVISAILIILVLFQEKGEGMSESIGGSGTGGFSSQRRGLEKSTFIITVIFLFLFVVSSVALLVIN
ncbi:MAG: preprotein translocase subunit SecG [Candidatus Paceibacterota bacterium]|jgi:protein translocase SecG subunit